jgi:hypothetical protein
MNGDFLSFVKFNRPSYLSLEERRSMASFVKRNLWIGMLGLFAAALAISALAG